MATKSTKSTKSTKIAKGSLKSATGGRMIPRPGPTESMDRMKSVSGGGTSNTAGAKAKSVTLTAKARELKTALKDASAIKGAGGLKAASAKAYESEPVKASSKKLLGSSAKSISAAGGIECDPKYQHSLGAGSGSIKVKVGGSSNLSTAQSVKGKATK